MNHWFIKIVLILNFIACCVISVIFLIAKAKESYLYIIYGVAILLGGFFFFGMYSFIADVEKYINQKKDEKNDN